MAWNPTTMTGGAGAERVVLCAVDDGVATVTLNRPHKSNSLNLSVFRELNAVVSRLHNDATVRAVIITGAGDRAFSAGADISELDGLQGAAAYQFSATGQFIFNQLEDLPKPVIAAINGAAFGGGLELALACDIRIAANTAYLGQPEITLANTPGWGATQRLPHVVGVGRATAMMLVGQPVDAETALSYGLVTEVLVPEQLRERALGLARDLSSRSPRAVHAIKEALHVGIAGGNEAGMRAERCGVAACSGTVEQVAAVRAFLDRGK
ncbi:MAG: enoyl-CoA hydratase/isomerase family protein [Microbacteriaceae bacterium]|nr:MAG: enoyl-CoA hydratase/isomerase family protein [Microbacteriaceae bacterium]